MFQLEHCHPVQRKGLTIVEDCAAAHGAAVGERPVGTIGQFGCFSSSIGKILRTAEGGMVLTADPEHTQALRELRVNGLRGVDGRTMVNRFGFNYTMPQVMAAIGRHQLARLDDMLAARQRNAAMLTETVAAFDGVGVLPDPVGRKRVFYELPFLLGES